MKKVLSIILIAAAAFGFYGGAVDITDVLDSKDYWEEQGRITDENLDKLEDGVNQLEENADAYLDGKVQYEEGQAKLADAKQQYEDGLDQIAETEAEYGGVGVPTLKLVKDNVDKLLAAKGSVNKASAIVAGSAGVPASTVKSAYENVNKLMKGYSEKDAIATVAEVGGVDASDVEQIYGAVKQLVAMGLTEDQAIEKIAENQVESKIKPLLVLAYDGMDSLVECKNNIDNSALVVASNSGVDKADIPATAAQIKAIYTNVTALVASGAKEADAIDKVAAATVAAEALPTVPAETGATIVGTVAGLVAKGLDDATLEATIKAAGLPLTVEQAKQIAAGFATAQTKVKAAYTNAADMMAMTPDAAANLILTKYADQVASLGVNATQVVAIYSTVKAAVKMGADKDATIGKVALTLGKKAAEDKISSAYEGVKGLITPKTLEQACAVVSAKAPGTTSAQIQLLYSNVAAFVKGLSWDEAVATVADAADMTPELIEEAYAGYSKYIQGKKDLAAAPAQIADGEAQLADAASQLAEYEDGMETLKDGLKTLIETKPEGGLKSIAARIGEGEDFLDETGFIDFEKALFGVEQGRAYSADSGDAITPELTNRAIAAGVGIGAAALALIAAILGLAKKKKGAGICGILAAVAGAAAVVMTNAAGDTWTILAGSTIGTMPVIAFGVVAAAALIFGIAQFGGKEA